MLNRFRITAGTPLIALLAALHGCGSTPPEGPVVERDPGPATNHYIGSEPLYAHLDQGSGGSWVFRIITDSDDPPDSGYLLRLNDLSPAFDIREAECEPHVYPANHKCNPAQPFRDKDIGVMDKIISGGLAAGTGGKVTEISRTYTTTFKDAAFNQAVDEALINTGLVNTRRDFINDVERYNALLESSRNELDARRQDALTRYRRTEQLAVDIRVRVDGLTSYYSADMDIRDVVHVEAQAADSDDSVALNEQAILPCDARRCADMARQYLQRLDGAIAQSRSVLDSSLAATTARYGVRCDATSHAGYRFVLACPETLAIPDSGAAVLPVTLTILSRDFDRLYPLFEIADERLSVKIDGTDVIFQNLTGSYLAINAQSIYYNSQVETRIKRIDLAPGVSVTRPIDDFVTPAIRVEASYLQMTPDKAEHASFRFGFAARYRLAGEADEVTLYASRSFNVGCAINNRLRPGSCHQLAPESGPSQGPILGPEPEPGPPEPPANDPEPDPEPTSDSEQAPAT
jgi:hypothetical protein